LEELDYRSRELQNVPRAATIDHVQDQDAPMKTVVIPNTDLEVSRIAFGLSKVNLGQSGVHLINVAIERGINLFDHADVYGEEPFGRILKRSPGIRDKIVIQTKCGLGVTPNEQTLLVDSSRDYIIQAAERSLSRFGISYIDILLLHWPDLLMEPEEVARAFQSLRRDGKVRYFGVSNHTPAQIELLSAYVDQPLVVNQVYLALENSYLIAKSTATMWDPPCHSHNYSGADCMIDYCRLHNIQIQAWSPLKGKLLNPSDEVGEKMKHGARVLAAVAKQKGVAPAAVALAWLLRHPANIIPITMSNNAEHLVDSCAADGVVLSREEWYELLAATFAIQSLRGV
jgi:predicted oxidoreductase